MSAPPFCALVLFAVGVRGADTSDGCEHTSLLQSSASRGQRRGFEDLCFKQVQRLMPYDSLLSPRIATKNELFMAAMASGKPMEDIVKDIMNELSAKNGHPADGTMSACGPTGSWLAELYIGLIGEITLGNPSDWEVYGSQKLWDAFTKERNAGKHMFWYMMTSGSHQSHIWSIEQLPKTEDQPVRYRTMMSCFDQYTLTAWLADTSDKATVGFLKKQRHVYPSQNDTASLWRRWQNNNKFDQVGVCIMEPAPEWPSLLQEWVSSALEYDVDASMKDLLTAQQKYGGSKVFTDSEFFGAGGYLSAMVSWLRSAEEAATSFPLGEWDLKLHEGYIQLFGFPPVDHFPGVPYIAWNGAHRDLLELRGPENMAKSWKAERSSKMSGAKGDGKFGFLVQAVEVDEATCERNANIILQNALAGKAPPHQGLAPSMRPLTKEEVCQGLKPFSS
ncbi:unnamed protein product [Effrenium voratum]|nr:unnamed protein product [Effrenium voratum]